MKLHVISDLHLEFGALEVPEVEADVLVLAGDIHIGTAGINWAAEVARGLPVIYVAGNHEFYDGHIDHTALEMRERAAERGVHFLEKGEITIDGVRFLGTTLWTDFKLYADTHEPGKCMREADLSLNDFRLIRKDEGRAFLASESALLHEIATTWLQERLADSALGKTVVVTHHCPHPRSVPERFVGSPLSPAFSSDLSELMESYRPVLWVHGHVHDSFDYMVGETRIVCNPRGYFRREMNADFNPAMVIEV